MVHALAHAGDRLHRSVPAEGLEYAAIVVSERVESAGDLWARGIPIEHAGPGGYVEVVEIGRGARPRSIGRRLTDEYGRLVRGQTLVRHSHDGGVGFAEQQQPAAAPINWCQMRQTIAQAARAEEARWTGANGAKLLENNPTQLPILTQYWAAVPEFSNNPAGAANAAQLSAIDHDDWPWSAAFICFVMRTAGIQQVHGFEFARRHMNFIVGALRNRERSDRNRPFWLADHIEVVNEALPQPGDLVCLNRCIRRPNHHDPGCQPDQVWSRHTYASLRQQFWDNGHHNDPVFGNSHTAIVVGATQVGGQPRLETIGGNEAGSVRLRTNIVLNAHGGIDNPQGQHIFGLIKLIGC